MTDARHLKHDLYQGPKLVLVFFFYSTFGRWSRPYTLVALLSIITDDTTGAAFFSPESISVVVNDEILVSGPTSLADSFILLFGYIYELDLQYSKKLELTFTFIQKVAMCLENNKPLKGRQLTLKNDLFNE